jgi:uncharacterized membrane protein YgdD (TMEM256/DUF423 family)
MVRIFLVIAALLGGLSVASGAFATHALRERLAERAHDTFETAARYQMYHALALLFVGLLLSRATAGHGWLIAAGWAFVAGVLIFSGSLYTLSLSGIKVLGAVAPVGGAALLIGWGCLMAAALNWQP